MRNVRNEVLSARERFRGMFRTEASFQKLTHVVQPPDPMPESIRDAADATGDGGNFFLFLKVKLTPNRNLG